MLMPVIGWKSLWAKRGVKVIVIGLGPLLALGGVGVFGYYYFWPEPAPKPPPPVQTATTQAVRDYLASEDFRRLPIDQRIEWLDQQRQAVANMTPEDRRSLWRDTDEQTRRRIAENIGEVMEERMNRDVATYHSLPPSEREAFLDKKIDEMQPFRGRGGFGMGGGPGMDGGPRGDRGPRPEGQAGPGGQGRRPEGFRGGPGGPGGGPPQGVRGRGGGAGGPGGRMARMPADRRAEFSVYRRALAKRMAERGLAPPGPPSR